MASQSLITLSMLKVGIDRADRDYLSHLYPFVFHVMSTTTETRLEDKWVADQLLEQLGLRIPKAAVNLVLKRLAKQGFFRREEGLYVRTERPIPNGFEAKRHAARERIEALTDAYRKYVFSKFGIPIDEERAGKEIVAFLREFSIECLRAYTYGSALPEVKAEDKTNPLFRVASFVRSVRRDDRDVYESFILLIKANMSANALVCPDLESLERKFDSVRFYLDTSIVLDLLALQSVDDERSANELVGLLRNLKGTICCFEHTLDEIDGVLFAAINNYGKGTPVSRLDRAIVERGISKSDLMLLKERLRDEIEAVGIKVERTPRYAEEFQISEVDLEGAVRDEVHHSKERALQHDVNSIRSIYVLRKGFSPRRLEDARAVFVTGNDRLAKAAFNYGRQFEVFKEVSSTITDYSLANIAWLKAPLGAPDLPEKELLALASAVMDADTEFWDRVLVEADRLQARGEITAEDSFMFRSSTSLREELLNLTEGRDVSFSPGAIKEAIRNYKEKVKSERDDEVERLTSSKEAVETELAKYREKQERQKKIHYWRIDKQSGWISILFTAVAVVVGLALSIYFSALVGGIVDGEKIGILEWLFVITFIFTLVCLETLRIVKGISVESWIKTIAHGYKMWRLKKIASEFDLVFDDLT